MAKETKTTDTPVAEDTAPVIDEMKAPVENVNVNETPKKPKASPTTPKSNIKPIEETKDEFDEILKKTTDEAKKLVSLMKEYKRLCDVPETKMKKTDYAKRVATLCEILYYPHYSSVKNPNYLYDGVEKLLTKYRNTVLHESFALQYGYLLNDDNKFQKCMVIYSSILALVQTKKLKMPLTVNIDNVSKLLGPSFETFIVWLSNRIEKLK